MLGSLSLISHKEVRFIYPLLPLLHILATPQITNFFLDFQKVAQTVKAKKVTNHTFQFLLLRRKGLLILSLAINATIALYATTVHQSGALNIIPLLRNLYESNHLTKNGVPLDTNIIAQHPYLAFLMPCHSTPFRSALIHSNLTAWALTCSPPLHIPPHSLARASYRDEADRFFDDPESFLVREVGATTARQWPEFVVGFQGIDEFIRKSWETKDRPGAKVVEVARIFNSHWHDDPRRKGDVVVWKLIRGQNSSTLPVSTPSSRSDLTN
ncbi:hypothetical protein K3495_g11499 [Podosphaera aphanis]|nr:hypothetical protein K3495_g11499 [Podosphaera aphanis]